MCKFDQNRIKDGWEKLCTNKQTNKQTDSTKIMVTWPWTKHDWTLVTASVVDGDVEVVLTLTAASATLRGGVSTDVVRITRITELEFSVWQQSSDSAPVLPPGESLCVYTLLVSPLARRLWTNMTSSTKPEVHNINISRYRQRRRTEPYGHSNNMYGKIR